MKGRDQVDCLVVGAGFAGSVVARELADAGRRVHVVDRRPHLAGNAFDEPDASGVLIHRYGPHIFYTNSRRIFEFGSLGPASGFPWFPEMAKGQSGEIFACAAGEGVRFSYTRYVACG